MENRRKFPAFLTSLPLSQAVLCADCEVISDSAGDTCEVCGSRSLLSLGRVLGGSIEGRRAALVPSEEAKLHSAFTVLVNRHASAALQRRRRKQSAPPSQGSLIQKAE